MRVIAMTTELDVTRGGKQRSMLDVCRQLTARGHEINLLYLKNGDLHQNYAEFCPQIHRIHTHDINKRDWRSLVRFGQSVFSLAHQLAPAQRSISAHTPAVIYLDDHMLSLFGYGLGLRLGLPVVFHIRQPVVQPMPQQYQFPLRRLDQFITVSQQVQQDWATVGLPRDRIQVVHNGIDPARFQPGDPAARKQAIGLSPQTRVITYLGRLDPGKGLETLIAAIAHLAQAHPEPPIQVDIIGRPVLHPSREAAQAYVATLKTQAQTQGVGDVIAFQPFVADPLPIYQRSDLVILPSTYPEPFGRTVIEAMACGVPAIGSHNGGIPEILTGEFAAGLFPPGDASALADRLHTWLHWRDRDPVLGDRARHHVQQRFSLTHTVEHIESILHTWARL